MRPGFRVTARNGALALAVVGLVVLTVAGLLIEREPEGPPEGTPEAGVPRSTPKRPAGITSPPAPAPTPTPAPAISPPPAARSSWIPQAGPLPRGEGRVVGRVLHADGTPAAAYRIKYRKDDDLDQGWHDLAVTNASGVFDVHLPPGGGWLLVMEPRAVSYDLVAERWLRVPRAGAEEVVEVRLPAMATVELRRPRGFPKWNAELRRHGAPRFSNAPVAGNRFWGSDNSGKPVRHLPPGTYDVSMTVQGPRGVGWASATLALRAGERRVVDLEPKLDLNLGHLRGRVVDGEGRGARAWLTVVPCDPDLRTLLGGEGCMFGAYQPWNGFPSQKDGTFTSPPLPPGRWAVRAYPLDGRRALAEGRAFLPAGADGAPLRLELPRARRVTLELPAGWVRLQALGPLGMRFTARRGRATGRARSKGERLVSGLDPGEGDEERVRRANRRARRSVLGAVGFQASVFVWGEVRPVDAPETSPRQVVWARVGPGSGDVQVPLHVGRAATVSGRVLTGPGANGAGAGVRVRLLLRVSSPQTWNLEPCTDPMGGGSLGGSDPPSAEIATFSFAGEHRLPRGIPEPPALGRVRTGPDGGFSFGLLPPGSYWLQAGERPRVRVEVGEGEARQVTLVLP